MSYRADAIDLVYRKIDALLLAGKFDDVGDILFAARYDAISDRITLSELLGILTITTNHRSELKPWRDALALETEVLAINKRGTVAAERMLRGLL